jgi:16S rRNA (guanine(1405)-N(7))-methyltransferase
MSGAARDELQELVDSVRASKKYAAISEELIRGIGRRELAARRSLKEAAKATRNKLHQVAGAYLDAHLPYADWLAMLAAARDERGDAEGRQGDKETRRQGDKETDTRSADARFGKVCSEIMRHHASTRERLPILETFYATALATLPPVRSVLDVACGLNPLALPWMPLAPGATYLACDIYADMVEFLNGFFAIAGIHGQAQVCDLLSGPPRAQVDLALVLKALPPLEQLEKGAGRELLRAIDARYLLVSFPARSLGGREKGMVETYAGRFRELAAAEGWAIERFAFTTELAFLVRR